MKLTKQELQILLQVLNEPRQQNLETATVLIQLNNKLSQMIEEFEDEPEKEKKK